MGVAGNFNPEWGYVAPTPGFMRTIRIVLIATAVGAAVGGGVVVSLVDRTADATSEDSVAARTLARRARSYRRLPACLRRRGARH